MTPSLSSNKKGLKEREIKSSVKMYFLKIQETGNLIFKKDEGLK